MEPRRVGAAGGDQAVGLPGGTMLLVRVEFSCVIVTVA